MRTAFVETLTEAAAADDRVFLLTGDLGWSVVERFAERFPRRYLNVGVAEANAVGVATGLAQVGFVPFVYSIASFTSMRCYEQVRDGPVLHGLPVVMVGIGGGFAYGHAGPTHYALEDLALARVQPGMRALAPADPPQTRAVVRALLQTPGPAYVRVGKGGNPTLPGLEGRFAFGRPERIRDGADVLLLVTGSIAAEVLGAAERLQAQGCSAAVAVLAHVGFTASPELLELLRAYPAVVTIEEGYAAGGLGSLVAAAIAEGGLSCPLLVRAVERPFTGVSGSEAFMRKAEGLDAASIADAVRSHLKRT